MKKNYIFLLVSLLVLLTWGGCSSGDDDELPTPTPEPEPEVEADYIQISSQALSVSAEGGTLTLSFTTNASWTAAADQSWCVLSPTSGNQGTQSVSAVISVNTEYTDRTATVTIQAGTASQTVSIEQYRLESIIIGQESYELEATAGTLEVGVESNVEYTVEISADWLEQDGQAGSLLRLSYGANTLQSEREATVTLSGKQARTSFVVRQKYNKASEGSIEDMPHEEW